MQLSKRQIKIVNHLLDNDRPLTTSQLAQHFKVSVRTIKYDLSDIKPWINARQNVLISKRNKGVWIQANGQEKSLIKRSLLKHKKFDYFPDPKQRAQQIIVLFDLTDGYMTTQQLENKLYVSKTTVVSDLNTVERQLNRYHVKLIRKNYYGYTITGLEANIRSVLEEIVQSTVNHYDLATIIDLFSVKPLEVKFGISDELDAIYQRIFKIVKQLKILTATSLDYNDILTIAIRLGIAVARLSINRPINSYCPVSIKESEKNQLPYQLFQQVFNCYDFSLLQDEYAYIANGPNANLKDQNIVVLTEKILNFVSTSTGHPYQKDNQLRTNLFSHLMMKLTSQYKFTNEYNPFVADVKQKYPRLFHAIYQVTKKEISANPAVVNDSFITFIALHFLVSLEKYVNRNHNIRIVYICSTGLGVTNLIQQKVEASLSGVEIAGFASFVNAKKEIKRLQPDLVISIFPLKEVTVPVIEVNPVPSNQDISKIKQKIADLKEIPEELLTPNNQTLATTNKREETVSRDLIIKGFTVYEQVKAIMGHVINSKYQDALLLHILMSVHRIYYDQQYQQVTDINHAFIKFIEPIKQVYLNNGLEINDSELVAIIEYLNFS